MSDSHETMSMLSHITTDDDARPSLPAPGRFPELKAAERFGTSFALPPLATPRSAPRRIPSWAVLAGGGVAVVLALGALSVYLLPDRRTDPPTVSEGLTQLEGSATAFSAASEPVRFANPFDKEEVFEFPAGTSQDQARDAVAELLKTRATERSAAGLLPKAMHPTGRNVTVDRGRVRTPQG